jgi:hypothetical protein
MGVGAAVAAIGTAIASVSVADVAIGVGIGALAGGALSAVEGKPILTGILEGGAVGGLTGGLGSIGASLGASAGIGATAGGALGGAAAGALGSEITGGNPAIGALTGAVSGGVQGYGSGTPAAGGSTGAAPAEGTGAGASGPGVGAAATAAPAGVDPDFGTVGTALQGPTASGATLDSTLADNPAPLAGGPATGPVPAGTELAGQDAAALQANTTQAAAGGTNSVGVVQTVQGAAPDGTTAGSVGGGAASGGGGGGAPSGYTIPGAQAANDSFPIPPMEPSLDAAGNPMVDAAGNTLYPTEQAALYQGQYNEAAAAGFPNTTPAAGGNSIAAAWDNPSFGTVGKALGDNANWLLPAAGLAYQGVKALGSTTPSPSALTGQLQGQANTLAANGQQLQSYLSSGTLPAGVQNSIASASQAAKASIRSQYAAHGMSGSSAEAADLAAVDTRAASQGAEIATQLLQTGINETQLANGIYEQLLNHSIQQDNQLSSAVGNFASSLVPRQNITLSTSSAG